MGWNYSADEEELLSLFSLYESLDWKYLDWRYNSLRLSSYRTTDFSAQWLVSVGISTENQTVFQIPIASELSLDDWQMLLELEPDDPSNKTLAQQQKVWGEFLQAAERASRPVVPVVFLYPHKCQLNFVFPAGVSADFALEQVRPQLQAKAQEQVDIEAWLGR